MIETTPEIQASDEPLFVLKYRRYKVVLRIIWYSLAGAIFALGTYFIPTKHPFEFEVLLGTLVFGFGCLSSVWLITHMLLFVEIRLYRDRIVRVRKLLSDTKIRLANAYVMALKVPPVSLKEIVNKGDAPRLRDRRAIVYDEYLADREEARKLNSLLAELSGRRVEEFERFGTTTMERFINGENT